MSRPAAFAAPRRASRSERVALAVLFSGAVTIAFSALFVRWAETAPIATGVYRMGIAGLFLLVLPFLVPSARPLARAPATRRDKAFLIAAGLLFTADIAAWHPALMMTTISNAMFIGNLSAVFVTLGAWLIFRQRIGWVFVLGLLATLCGTALLMGVSMNRGGPAVIGDALSLLAALFYGGYFLIVAHLRPRLTTLTIMKWTSLAAAIGLIPCALIEGGRLVPATLAGWGPLLGIGLVVHVAGQGMIAYAFAHLPAHFTAMATFIQPVAAAMLAWLLLGEALGWVEIGGCAIILLGIWIARHGTRRPVPPAAPELAAAPVSVPP